MPLKKDSSGAHSVTIEFEAPGTPEQVWRAIATGPGVTAWFVPTTVDERVGGDVAFDLGGGLVSTGRVTAWSPPHRFAYEEPNWSGEAPPLATELIVEAKAGGVCKVKMVHSLFTDRDDWDKEIESMENGWPPFIAVLKLYLTHHPDAPAASARPTAAYAGSVAEAWTALLRGLDLSSAKVGETRATRGDGAPHLAGCIEQIGDQANNHKSLMLRMSEPAPGAALIGVYAWGGETKFAISLYFYGDDCATIAAREEKRWQTWLEKAFAPVGA